MFFPSSAIIRGAGGGVDGRRGGQLAWLRGVDGAGASWGAERRPGVSADSTAPWHVGQGRSLAGSAKCR